MQYEVRADELTLAVAIPSQRADVDRQYQFPERYDYIASVKRRYPGLSTEGLWRFLCPTLEIGNYVATRSAANGVSVLKGFQAPQLKSVLTGRRVVTLVAHWRNTPIRRHELLSPELTLAEIRSRPDHVCSALNSALTMDGCTDDVAELLANAMNTCIQIESRKVGEDWNSSLPATPDTLALTRADLEERFPDGLMASPDIELADGLISTAAFIACIPEDFEGVLDLTVCNSLILGTAIKRKRPQITVVMNRREASGRHRLLLYLALVAELKRQPQLYCDAAIKIREALKGNMP